MQVVLATRNAGKIRELAKPLKELGVEVLGLADFPEIGEIEENGTSFAENALLKAGIVAEKTGLIAIADDSGLEVKALQGEPGIYSARYADDWDFVPGESVDARNIRKLLANLKDVPYEERHARFVCCMAAVRPKFYEPEDTLVVQGTWEGRILNECHGTNGFGYDPIFCDIIFGITAAQMSNEDKMVRSHRGEALRFLIKWWPKWIATEPKNPPASLEESQIRQSVKKILFFFLAFIFVVTWDVGSFAQQKQQHGYHQHRYHHQQKRHRAKHRRHHVSKKNQHKQAGHGMHGLATWYGRDWHGRPTSSGELFDCKALTAAHRSLPLGSHVNVTNLRNGQSVTVRINDRGPFVRGLVIDVSEHVAEMLGFKHAGKTPVALKLVR